VSLVEYVPERTPIAHKGKTLVTVRGLNYEDVTVLVRAHLKDISRLFAGFKEKKLLPSDIEPMLLDLLTSSPQTAATIIAIAADEPDYSAAALKLPLSLAVTILYELVRLTFEYVGGPLVLVTLILIIMWAEEMTPDQPTIQ
jgi:hypothetical protein